MDKQDIINCENMLTLFNEMYFKELSGKDLVQKMMLFKNFAITVNKMKTPIEPVSKPPITPVNKPNTKKGK